METPKNNDNEIFEAIAKDRAVRQAVTKQSHPMFFSIMFSKYVKYQTAEFQKDIFRITEDQSNKLACIVAFRGSGKSTLITLSYALWSILGVQQKKFVLIICQTQAMARHHMANIKHELEHNDLLKSDLGPFREEDNDGEWAMSSLVFHNTGARIMAASVDQSIRGVRHHEHRPDLIILDDIEDLGSTKTIEGRNKTFDWFTREIVPLGDIGTRIIIVGNLLHEDSLMMRLRKKIDNKEIGGIYRWFPLVGEDGKCLWPEKFDTEDKLDDLRKSVANELAWRQEYLLEIASDTSRVIFPEWIQRSDLPKDVYREAWAVIIGVDLAISQKTSADYTAIVTGVLCGSGDDIKMYILPNPINKRMTYAEAIETIRGHAKSLPFKITPTIVIEANGFQKIYAEQLSRDTGFTVEEVKNTSDKRTRIALTSYYTRNGLIQFSKVGNEDLITQLTGFGSENHDDLADAFSTMVIHSIELISQDRSFYEWRQWVIKNGGPWI